MPILQSSVLSLSVSSSPQGGRKTIHTGDVLIGDVTVELPAAMAVMPVELTHGCSESGLTVDSDDVHLTNFIRKHYLEHFGHRDLNGMMSDYANNADTTIIHNVTSFDNQKNGGIQEQHTKSKFHGKDEIRSYYSDLVFQVHNDHSCTFHLESITINSNQATVSWTARTPTISIVDAVDRYVFNGQGLILKQFFSCETHERENIGTPAHRLSASSSSPTGVDDYSGFFESEK